jgi:hypothetical protein
VDINFISPNDENPMGKHKYYMGNSMIKYTHLKLQKVLRVLFYYWKKKKFFAKLSRSYYSFVENIKIDVN